MKEVLPKEGDLIFEKKNSYWSLIWGVFTTLIVISFIANYKEVLKEEPIGITLKLLWFLLCLFTSIACIQIIIDGLKNGFQNETYKAYYFPEKFVFHRISKTVDNTFINNRSEMEIVADIREQKTRIELLSEQLSHLSKKNKGYANKEAEFFLAFNDLKRHTEALHILKNRSKVHIVDVKFEHIKHLMANDSKNTVNIVVNRDYTSSKFFEEVELVPKYSKNKAEVVAFLNKRVREVCSKKNLEAVLEEDEGSE